MDEIWENDQFRGYKPSAQALGRAEALITNANISPEFKDWLMAGLYYMTADEINEMCTKLEAIQAEPVDPAKQFNERS